VFSAELEHEWNYDVSVNETGHRDYRDFSHSQEKA
jgi:hypothetical protein